MTAKARLASEAAVVIVAIAIVAWAGVAGEGWYEHHVAAHYCIDGPTWPWHAVRLGADRHVEPRRHRPLVNRLRRRHPLRHLAHARQDVLQHLAAAEARC